MRIRTLCCSLVLVSAAVLVPVIAGCKTSASPPPAPSPAPSPPPTRSAVEVPPMKPPVPNAPIASEADLARIAAGDRELTPKLYAQLRGQPGNLFLSPASIRLALAMTRSGAQGETRRELDKALALDDTSDAGFAALLAEWKRRAELSAAPGAEPWQRDMIERRRLVLRVANRLWGQKGRAFKPEYLATTRDRYGAALEPLDFVRAAEPSRLAINQWVEQATEQKIKDLLPPGAVDASTLLVLTNAVYFKAVWSQEFNEAQTRPEPFQLAPGKSVPASTMRQNHWLRTGTIAGARVIDLPYGADGVAMWVVIPDAVDGLATIESALSIDALEKALGAQPTFVELHLPRFRFTSSFNLNPALAALGLSSAFTPQRADFSGIDGTRDLFLGAVVHKAFVAVDEKGTEAAAATAVALAGSAMPPKPTVVRADRPFLFVILDTKLRSVLFLGRVADPTKS